MQGCFLFPNEFGHVSDKTDVSHKYGTTFGKNHVSGAIFTRNMRLIMDKSGVIYGGPKVQITSANHSTQKHSKDHNNNEKRKKKKHILKLLKPTHNSQKSNKIIMKHFGKHLISVKKR